jgi:hypothetical protein
MTQTEQIREHLLTGRDITPLQALDTYGCFRLAARIDELRQAGLDIETVSEMRNGKKFARYRLRVPQQDMFAIIEGSPR